MQMVKQIVRSVFSFIAAFFEIAMEVIGHWLSTGMNSISPRFLKKQHILKDMTNAASYKEWRKLALMLDKIEGNQVSCALNLRLMKSRNGK